MRNLNNILKSITSIFFILFIFSSIAKTKDHPLYDSSKTTLPPCTQRYLDNCWGVRLENNYSYYQYPSTIDGTRDINGNWVDSSRAFSDEKIVYDDEDNMMFFIIYNTCISDYIKQMTISELLSKNYNFTRFIKKTL